MLESSTTHSNITCTFNYTYKPVDIRAPNMLSHAAILCLYRLAIMSSGSRVQGHKFKCAQNF